MNAKKTTMIVIIIILAVVFVAGGIAIVFHFFNQDKPEKIGTITAFESMTLRESGMRVTQEYEILPDGDMVEISLYSMYYQNGEEERRLETSARCSMQTFVAKLNEYDVASWNGFHGKHPKYVLDGTMFTLEASVNGGKRLYADGSENFPRHYHELVQWLGEMCR